MEQLRSVKGMFEMDAAEMNLEEVIWMNMSSFDDKKGISEYAITKLLKQHILRGVVKTFSDLMRKSVRGIL